LQVQTADGKEARHSARELCRIMNFDAEEAFSMSHRFGSIALAVQSLIYSALSAEVTGLLVRRVA
jgi:hypothetical protein